MKYYPILIILAISCNNNDVHGDLSFEYEGPFETFQIIDDKMVMFPTMLVTITNQSEYSIQLETMHENFLCIGMRSYLNEKGRVLDLGEKSPSCEYQSIMPGESSQFYFMVSSLKIDSLVHSLDFIMNGVNRDTICEFNFDN